MSRKDQQFFQPVLDPTQLITNPQSSINICVLKHLQKPLQLLDKDDSYLNFSDPVCLFASKLHSLPEKLLPSQQNTLSQTLQPTRLTALQHMEQQLKQLKQQVYEKARYRTQYQHNTHNNHKFNNQNNQQQQCGEHQKPSFFPSTKVKTLFSLFSQKSAYYCRFQNHMPTKHNFANVFINVAGINLQARAISEATTKSTSNQQRKLPKLNNINSTTTKTQKKRQNSGSLVFDSSFESGNLLYVYEKRSFTDGQQSDNNSSSSCSIKQYQLILQNDTNTYGHNQWFFFRVQSLKPYQTVKFSILNLIKSDSLFNYGLKPLVYSQRENSHKNIGWLRRGQNVKYYQNDIRRQNKKQNYFTLQFEYTFRDTKDWVYFCPSYLYTYTQMTNCIENLYQNQQYKRCFSVKTVCETLGKNKITLISISTGRKMIEESKVVWVIARQHPSETTGSFMVEGMLKYLIALVSRAKFEGDTTSQSTKLSQLDDYVFKIVPMVNVDGVIHGNSRAQLIGLDPNRLWRRPRKSVNPVIYHLLKQVQSSKSNISLILDLHSHSKKTGCFFYGNQSPSNTNTRLSKLYPTLISENDQRFVLKNCRYRGGYKTTARHVLFSELNNCENVFTVECSLLGYLNSRTKRIVEYTIQDYHQMGAKLIETFFKLQKIKLQKNANQFLSQFDDKIQQVCQVDSAKSDSAISDDEYEEIKELERKLLNYNTKKLHPKVNRQRKNNKSLVANTVNQNQQFNKIKKRACSFNNNNNNNKNIQFKNISSKHQNNPTSLRYALNQSLKKVNTSNINPTPKQHQPLPLINSILCSRQHTRHVTQQANNSSSSNNTNTISSLKQSYMKYLANSSKLCHQSKARTEDVSSLGSENNSRVKKDFGTQVVSENLPTQSEKRVLEASETALNTFVITDPKIRPLLVLGSTCHTQQYTLYSRNEVSIQVNSPSYDDPFKKEQKAIAKLPKLMNMISVSKDRIRKMTLAAYKENQNFTGGTPVGRYNDTKTILYQEKQKRTVNKLVVNFKSSNV